LHHQKELFAEVERELDRIGDEAGPPSSPLGVNEGSLTSPRLRLLNPSEPRRLSEWGEVRRLLLAIMMARVPTDQLPIPLLWDMLVPGLETLPLPLLMAADFPEGMRVDGECPCIQRAEPCLCLSPEEWRQAWRGLKRHRSKARDQLSQSSVANPFADPLLRSICSGVSERLHRMEREETREGLLGIPEGVEEQLILLGEYIRRAVYPGTCAAQALAAVLPTLVEVKGLLKAFHVEVRKQNEARATAELRAGSLDSLSPMQSMRTPRPGDLYRWRRLMIALAWTASALLDCSDAVMAEGILATLLGDDLAAIRLSTLVSDIPVTAPSTGVMSPSSPDSLRPVAPPLYTLLSPVLAAAFFPESVEDSGLWVHPEVEDRRLALDRLRLLTTITAILNVIRRALGSTKDTPTVYVPLAARLRSAWASIAQHSAPVVMGTWMASIFAHGTGVIPRFLTSRTPLRRLDGATTPETLLELKLAEAETALFSIPAELNDFLVDPHVGWYIHHHYSRFIRLYRRRPVDSTVPSPSAGSPSRTSSYASTAPPCQQEAPVENSLAVAQLGVLRALAGARSPGARKKFHSLRVVDFLCGEIDLEHAAYHMEGRYREFTSRGGQDSRRASDAEESSDGSSGTSSERYHRVESFEHSPSEDLPARATQQEADYPKVGLLLLNLSFGTHVGSAPSTQGCAALLGAAPAEEVSRDPTTAAVGGGGGKEEPLIPPPTALPPATHAEAKDYRRSLSAPLPPPVSYSDCGDGAQEEDSRIEGSGSSSSFLSSSSSPCSSRLPPATALSPPVVPRLAFQGLPPSVQGPGSLGIDPTPPEYVTGGVAKESPQTPEPSGQIPPLTTIDDAEGYRGTGRAAPGRGRPRLTPELFYDCGRKCRRLYRSEELQEGKGASPNEFPALNGKVNVLFMLSVHLRHQSNIGALRRLRHHEGLPSIRSCPSSPHRGLFRLLKLLAPGNFPQWIYADMKVVGGGAFGTVYRCETVLDGGDEEVVAVKLVSRNPDISDRCVLYDVFNEVTCLEEGRFDDYMAEIFDYGYDGCSYWIIMRFYDMTLTAWRSRLAQPLGDHLLDLLQAYRKILTAVGKLHRDGLVHYDLKCDNIMVLETRYRRGSQPTSTARGSSSGIAVVLADFGESRVLEGPHNTDLCVRNRGTEFVKPPEMLTMERALRRDDAAFDRRRSVGTTTASDVWSLGCMLYELITGQYLFYNDDWIRFFMRLTGGLTGRGVEGGRHGSPATAMPLDILTEENIEKLDNNASLCDFIRQGGFMLVREPQCRPTVAAILHRFQRVYAAVQLERGIRPHTWRSRHSHDYPFSPSTTDPRVLPIPGEANAALEMSTVSSARHSPAAASRQSTPPASAASTRLAYLPDDIVEAPAGFEVEPRLSRVFEDTLLLTVPPQSNSVPESLVREALPTHVIDLRPSNEPNLSGFPATVTCVRASWGHLERGSRRSTRTFINNIPLLFDFARSAAASRGRLFLIDTGHVAMAFLALVVSEGHRLSIYRALCLLLSRHLSPLDQPYPRLIMAMAKWQQSRFLAWAHHDALLANGCMTGSCLCGVCSWILRTSAVRSIVPFRGIIHDDVPTIVTCRCSPAEPVKACANLYSCAAYCQYLRSMEGGDSDPSDAAVWLWLPATLNTDGEVKHCPFFRRTKGAEVSRGLDGSAVAARKKGGAVPCQAGKPSGSVMMSRMYRCVYCRVLSHAVVSVNSGGGKRGIKERGWVVLNLTNDAHRLRELQGAPPRRRLGDRPPDFNPDLNSSEDRVFSSLAPSLRGSLSGTASSATPAGSRRSGIDAAREIRPAGGTPAAATSEDEEYYYPSNTTGWDLSRQSLAELLLPQPPCAELNRLLCAILPNLRSSSSLQQRTAENGGLPREGC
ncbi:hypothetical protein FOZ63_034127, partial [Perkinsus olseni]